ncbi:hypothetical protein CDEST_09500 [Colletotrichum destructivum]|uniref:Uncharacterized protein n=1 Tax=Colletotrichum destructivum TaxID=34406 RepID=A0AAX4ILW9_9PEZI|nr:hypothetical protein CDEST_09500 [Colletotrichum destructivum]
MTDTAAVSGRLAADSRPGSRKSTTRAVQAPAERPGPAERDLGERQTRAPPASQPAI